MIARRAAAEAVGTFMLVTIGPGAAAVDRWSGGQVTHLGVALSFGFVVLAAVYSLGHISGAHLNPAVTIGFWSARRFPGADVAPYVVAQLVGAAAAAALLRLTVGSAAMASVTTPALATAPSLIIELVLSLFLMLVIMAVATDARVAGPVAGLAVGLTVAFDAIVGGPLTGASMNPARSFGPALANGIWSGHWIYWAGPICGALLGVRIYDVLRPGVAHDLGREATAARALPVHGQFGTQSDGRSHSQREGEGTRRGT